MLREPARAGLLAACFLMSTAAPAVASAPEGAPLPRAVNALLGWGTALMALSVIGWAASAHLAPRRQRRRAERERIARLLARLEAAQRARLAERERAGWRGRRRAPDRSRPAARAATFEGGVTFGAPLPAHRVAAPAPEPASPPDPAPAPAVEPDRSQEEAKASERLARLLHAVAETERRLDALRGDLDRVSAASSVTRAPETQAREEAPLAAQTIDLGPLDLPPPGPPEEDGFDATSDELLARLRALGGLKAAPEKTVDLGPLELPGEAWDLGTLEVPEELLGRLNALAARVRGERQGTLDLGALELPDGELAPDTLVLVADDVIGQLHAVADMAIPEGSFTPIVTRDH